MRTSQLMYRTRQFWQAIFARVDDELVSSFLTSAQLSLFSQMQASEQAHSQKVLEKLISQGEQNKDLLVAALLHDVGKIRAPLRLWERVLIVLTKSICPACINKWGQLPHGEETSKLGWRKAFVVSVHHPEWGAVLAEQCGTSQQAVELIARHEEFLIPAEESGNSSQDHLLLKLQAADSTS